ncbi:uncharacterized protein LOC126775326 [Nymphalis io]|uniref:uncharacterized protein LOC126775326 n=1 Tax=Inachis io TaxID=171585 RepID=UPI002169A188|nr:uncharacterized protein LOC126775326 [Nymphalis io]
MRALIEALQAPKPVYRDGLPTFDPDNQDTDARSWCATANLCFSENPPRGGQLILAVSKALKGEASTWLSQIAYEGITWPEFKVLFTSRFISTETLAGTLIKLNEEKPSEKESLPAYASRLIASLTNRWKDVNKEEIAVATVLAHLSQFDPRIQRLAFTTNINSREKLQQELNAFSQLKRKMNTIGESLNVPDFKRAKLTAIKCFNCEKTGHKRADCRSKTNDVRGRATIANPGAQQPVPRLLVCYKCGKPGHIAVRCTSGGGGSSQSGDGGAGAARGERRIDVCVVQPPSGTLEHKD